MMKYSELPVYEGPWDKCCNCGKTFRPSEVFTLADDGRLSFCYSNSDGCMQDYMFFKMSPVRMLVGNPYVFRTRVQVPVVVPLQVPRPRRWWQFWK